MKSFSGFRPAAAVAVAAGLLVAAPAVARDAPPAAAPAYAVVEHFAVGGEGGWDYVLVDPAAQRLYVPRSTHVMVLDAGTGKPAGEIPETPGVHGVALAPDLGRGFTSNGRSATVTVFELASLKRLADIKVTGENPDAILYERLTKRVFAFNGRSGNATVIDAAAGTVAATIPVGGKPEFAVSDGSARVYVNVEDTAEVVVIDAKKLEVAGRWPLTGCKDPTGLALDGRSGRLFVGCGNKVALVLNTAGGKVLATVPTGEGTDGVAFDPAADLAFVSSGDGTLTVIRETSPGIFAAVQNVATRRGARTVALDEKTHRLFLPTAAFGPPPPATPDRPHPRPAAVPGSFEILVVAPR